LDWRVEIEIRSDDNATHAPVEPPNARSYRAKGSRLMPARLASGIVQHISRAVTCRHDGKGLPASPRAVTFWLLFALAIVAIAVKVTVKGGAGNDMLAAGVAFTVTTMGLTIFAGSSLLPVVAIYFCASAGLDMIQALTVLGGHEVQPPIPAIWELACVVSAIAKVSRRVEAEKRT